MTAPILTSEQFAVVAARDAEIATLRASRDAALARVAEVERVLRELELDAKWREDLHPNDPRAMRYALDSMFDVREAQKALASPPPHPTGYECPERGRDPHDVACPLSPPPHDGEGK